MRKEATVCRAVSPHQWQGEEREVKADERSHDCVLGRLAPPVRSSKTTAATTAKARYCEAPIRGALLCLQVGVSMIADWVPTGHGATWCYSTTTEAILVDEMTTAKLSDTRATIQSWDVYRYMQTLQRLWGYGQNNVKMVYTQILHC